MLFPVLKFDTPENACQSLRLLAELARRHEIAVTSSQPNPGTDDALLRLTVREPGRGASKS